MKTTTYLFAIGISLFMLSCVSSKKYKSLDSNYEKSLLNGKECETSMEKMKTANNDLTKQIKDLSDQLDYLKKNNNQIINALQDMSVLSSKQAESVKQSLQTLSEKDAYIKNLQSAISRKDSLNMVLVMNLKGSLADINDKDIDIKVDKGVVYVDISDKATF